MKNKLRGCRSVAECQQDLNQQKWQLGHLVESIAEFHDLKQKTLKRLHDIKLELSYAEQQEATLKAKEEAEQIGIPAEQTNAANEALADAV